MKKICAFVTEVVANMVVHRTLTIEFPVLMMKIMFLGIAASAAVVVVVQGAMVVWQILVQHLSAGLM